jgi:hypothetical protein
LERAVFPNPNKAKSVLRLAVAVDVGYPLEGQATFA